MVQWDICVNTKYKQGQKTVLDQDDDVACALLGGSWRMPTKAETKELLDECTWTWTALNGVNGRRVTSKKEG